MDKIIISATRRKELGKKNKSLRQHKMIPAIAYGHSINPIPLKVDSKILEMAYSKAGSNRIIDLKIDDKEDKNVLIQAVQHSPRSGAIMHADFYVVKMDEKIKTEVPLHFLGESAMVYQEGGTLLKNYEALEVEALPRDLPESIPVDISVLDDFEKAIHIRDLHVPSGSIILNDPDELVAKIEPPRSEEELAELEEPITEELPEVEDIKAEGEEDIGEERDKDEEVVSATEEKVE